MAMHHNKGSRVSAHDINNNNITEIADETASPTLEIDESLSSDDTDDDVKPLIKTLEAESKESGKLADSERTSILDFVKNKYADYSLYNLASERVVNNPVNVSQQNQTAHCSNPPVFNAAGSYGYAAQGSQGDPTAALEPLPHLGIGIPAAVSTPNPQVMPCRMLSTNLVSQWGWSRPYPSRRRSLPGLQSYSQPFDPNKPKQKGCSPETETKPAVHTEQPKVSWPVYPTAHAPQYVGPCAGNSVYDYKQVMCGVDPQMGCMYAPMPTAVASHDQYATMAPPYDLQPNDMTMYMGEAGNRAPRPLSAPPPSLPPTDQVPVPAAYPYGLRSQMVPLQMMHDAQACGGRVLPPPPPMFPNVCPPRGAYDRPQRTLSLPLPQYDTISPPTVKYERSVNVPDHNNVANTVTVGAGEHGGDVPRDETRDRSQIRKSSDNPTSDVMDYKQFPYQQYSNPAKKPRLPYVTLLGLAILNTANEKASLCDIYEFVSRMFPYYRSEDNKSWKNTVRHTLSTQPIFSRVTGTKKGRCSDWVIHPACVGEFRAANFEAGRARNLVKEFDKSRRVSSDSAIHAPFYAAGGATVTMSAASMAAAGAPQYMPYATNMLHLASGAAQPHGTMGMYVPRPPFPPGYLQVSSTEGALPSIASFGDSSTGYN